MNRCEHGFVAPLCVVCHVPTRLLRKTRPIGNAEPVSRAGAYRCRFCGQTKPLSEFYIMRSSSLGHQSRCKTCDNRTRGQRMRGEVER